MIFADQIPAQTTYSSALISPTSVRLVRTASIGVPAHLKPLTPDP
jgi:hypothetical protein